MCDYSLEQHDSRPAKIGDKLVTSAFQHTTTRGFCASDSSDVAVCLLPGTELVFDRPVVLSGLSGLVNILKNVKLRTARFRHINENEPHTHHDALEFGNGSIVLLTRLRTGLGATVLQLPADPTRLAKPIQQEVVEVEFTE
jgi:hypothetical protein